MRNGSMRFRAEISSKTAPSAASVFGEACLVCAQLPSWLLLLGVYCIPLSCYCHFVSDSCSLPYDTPTAITLTGMLLHAYYSHCRGLCSELVPSQEHILSVTDCHCRISSPANYPRITLTLTPNHTHTTLMLPLCYPHISLMFPSCYPLIILILPSFYPHFTLILPLCYPHISLIFPSYYPHITLMLPA